MTPLRLISMITYFYEDCFHQVHAGLLLQEICWLRFIRDTSIFRTKEGFGR